MNVPVRVVPLTACFLLLSLSAFAQEDGSYEDDRVSREITVSDVTTHRQAVGSPYGTKQVRYGPHL
jgi:hypothetical protein